MRLILRVFVPAFDPEEAQEISVRLRGVLEEFATAPAGEPERYWKMPDRFEHTFHLHPATHATFDRVIARTPLGWHHTHVHGDVERSSVWSPEIGSFLLPEVAWAEILLVADPPETGS